MEEQTQELKKIEALKIIMDNEPDIDKKMKIAMEIAELKIEYNSSSKRNDLFSVYDLVDEVEKRENWITKAKRCGIDKYFLDRQFFNAKNDVWDKEMSDEEILCTYSRIARKGIDKKSNVIDVLNYPTNFRPYFVQFFTDKREGYKRFMGIAGDKYVVIDGEDEVFGDSVMIIGNHKGDTEIKLIIYEGNEPKFIYE